MYMEQLNLRDQVWSGLESQIVYGSKMKLGECRALFLRLLMPGKPWLELTQGWAGLEGPLDLGGTSLGKDPHMADPGLRLYDAS